ncbi:MAG: hypothetical protein U9R49_12435, partial [Bacteroidota bacterium]|nr:hypothetical protein [Bacteroidota bacterium]
IIHLRRPDGRDWDGILHVDPNLEIKGYALLYNPTGEEMQRTIQLPLYYTGLKESAMIQKGDGESAAYTLSRDYSAEIEVRIPAHGYLPIIVK